MSSEAEGVASELLTAVRNAIEAVLNRVLSPIEFNDDFEEWACIPVIMSGTFLPYYPEVVKRSSKRKVLEFRLHIAFDEFIATDEPGRIAMLFDSLERSIDLMPKLKVSLQSQQKFRDALSVTREIFEKNKQEAIDALNEAHAAIIKE